MESIRQDLELLRNKAADCELVARLATDTHARELNEMRARLYRELIEEAEERIRRSRQKVPGHLAFARNGDAIVP
jgi:hypothetical protein